MQKHFGSAESLIQMDELLMRKSLEKILLFFKWLKHRSLGVKRRRTSSTLLKLSQGHFFLWLSIEVKQLLQAFVLTMIF